MMSASLGSVTRKVNPVEDRKVGFSPTKWPRNLMDFLRRQAFENHEVAGNPVGLMFAAGEYFAQENWVTPKDWHLSPIAGAIKIIHDEYQTKFRVVLSWFEGQVSDPLPGKETLDRLVRETNTRFGLVPTKPGQHESGNIAECALARLITNMLDRRHEMSTSKKSANGAKGATMKKTKRVKRGEMDTKTRYAHFIFDLLAKNNEAKLDDEQIREKAIKAFPNEKILVTRRGIIKRLRRRLNKGRAPIPAPRPAIKRYHNGEEVKKGQRILSPEQIKAKADRLKAKEARKADREKRAAERKAKRAERAEKKAAALAKKKVAKKVVKKVAKKVKKPLPAVVETPVTTPEPTATE